MMPWSPVGFGPWVWAWGVSTLGLSWFYKQPILTAWSTPGAAILVTSLAGVPFAEAIGAFVACSVLNHP